MVREKLTGISNVHSDAIQTPGNPEGHLVC